MVYQLALVCRDSTFIFSIFFFSTTFFYLCLKGEERLQYYYPQYVIINAQLLLCFYSHCQINCGQFNYGKYMFYQVILFDWLLTVDLFEIVQFDQWWVYCGLMYHEYTTSCNIGEMINEQQQLKQKQYQQQYQYNNNN
eukprot:TRINITY_DN68273_c0_g1_i2.p6 TRINITY_DN68273_c0_g1~~TRINITY_DN68273_c0_g1_i2.p6  ORF type:complete len:138 (-),score=1.20 TRINITY_DN68273_c0_g1_i2:210-623(-)